MSDLKEAEAALEEDSQDQAFSNHVVALPKAPQPKDPRSKHKYNLVYRILFL